MHTFLSKESCSTSCREPRPFSNNGEEPPIRINGLCASCAFLSGVIQLVTPGPAVTIATPILGFSTAPFQAGDSFFVENIENEYGDTFNSPSNKFTFYPVERIIGGINPNLSGISLSDADSTDRADNATLTLSLTTSSGTFIAQLPTLTDTGQAFNHDSNDESRCIFFVQACRTRKPKNKDQKTAK